MHVSLPMRANKLETLIIGLSDSIMSCGGLIHCSVYGILHFQLADTYNCLFFEASSRDGKNCGKVYMYIEFSIPVLKQC